LALVGSNPTNLAFLRQCHPIDFVNSCRNICRKIVKNVTQDFLLCFKFGAYLSEGRHTLLGLKHEQYQQKGIMTKIKLRCAFL
jgi:hypothetical protein